MLTPLCLIGCSGGSSADAAESVQPCEVVAGVQLPEQVRETSGLARSARDPDIFWTHNDAGNGPVIFAVSSAGRLVQQVLVTGATSVDWEDIEIADCAAGSCLYVGDIGDNDGNRDRITVYRIPEPQAGDTVSAPATAFHARYPEGPRDAEGLFVDSAGRIYVVTKGRRERIELYRYPAEERASEVVTLEFVRQLLPQPHDSYDRATAATATPDRRWVGIRTYRTLYLYPAEDLVGNRVVHPAPIDLTLAGAGQWESLALSNDGMMWTSSEAGSRRGQPRLLQLRCVLPDAQPGHDAAESEMSQLALTVAGSTA